MKKLILVGVSIMALAGAVNAASNQEFNGSKIPNTRVKDGKIKPSIPLTESGEIILQRKTIDKQVREKKLTNVANKAEAVKTRNEIPSMSQKSTDFSFYDAWVTLDHDFDQDGYYSDFTVAFDADVVQGSANVYADIFIRENGQNWMFLADTNNFTINGSQSDTYQLSLSLLNDYPTGHYDILIDLYEVGVSGIAATIDASVDSDLYALPLEDAGYDGNTLITYVASEISHDDDYDGFFTRLRLEYDLDTLDSGRQVYVEVDLTNRATNFRRNVTSLDFTLGNQTEIIELTFESGLIDNYYDVEIRILDFYTDEEITYAAQNEFSPLRSLPLESREYDYDDFDVVVVHEGGGSMGWILLSLFGAVLFRRKFVN